MTFHLKLLDRFDRNKFFLSENSLHSPGDIKGSQSPFRISTLANFTLAYQRLQHGRLHATTRSLYRFKLVSYRNERKEEKTRTSHFYFVPFLFPRDTQRSVNTTKRRHIVPRVMAVACLSRCSYSMVDEIYRVSHRISF